MVVLRCRVAIPRMVGNFKTGEFIRISISSTAKNPSPSKTVLSRKAFSRENSKILLLSRRYLKNSSIKAVMRIKTGIEKKSP